MSQNQANQDSQHLAGQLSEALKPPRMFRVIMHNDNITEMDFVVDVLMGIFQKTKDVAVSTMMAIHEKGHGVAGVYTYDIAISKKIQCDRLANGRGFPLRVSLEEDPGTG